MKLKSIFIVVMLLTNAIAMNAQDNGLFSKLSEDDNISTVFISKALLQMVPLNLGGANIESLMDKLNQLEVYTTEKAATAEMMKKEAGKLVDNNLYENMMTIKDDESKVNFLFIKDKKNPDNISELLMLMTDTNECTIIRISGSFTMEDIQKLIES